MVYKLSDLVESKDTLQNKLINLGANPDFLKNPVFETILNNLTSDIIQLGYGRLDQIFVTEDNGVITFNSEEAYLGVALNGQNTIQCITTRKKDNGYNENFRRNIHEESISETLVELQGDGAIVVRKNHALVTDGIEDMDKTYCGPTASEIHYTKEGYMITREDRMFPAGTLNNRFQNIRVDSALYVPRQGFSGYYHDAYISREYMRREQIDTAYVSIENRETGLKYRGQELLSSEHGLQDMVNNSNQIDHSSNYVIPPAGPETINDELASDNPLVAEALKKAYGTMRQGYDTSLDKSFVYQSTGGSKSM